jgi:4-amino-4-deoxy-L-arabinose transferase-like glycosyltransferase
MMARGIGLMGDSAWYLAAAQRLDSSHLIHEYHAPLYPILLGWLARGLDSLGLAARMYNAVAFSLTTLALFGLLRWNCSAGPLEASIATAFTVFSQPLLANHADAASESTFFVFLMFTLISLSRYRLEPRSLSWLCLAGAFTALACVARYAGLAVIGFCGLAILWQNRRCVGPAILHTSLYAILSLSLVVVVAAHSRMAGERATGYELTFNGLNQHKAMQGVSTIIEWAVPYRLIAGLDLAGRIVVVLIGLGGIAWAFAMRRDRSAGRGAGLLACFALLYLLYAWATVAFAAFSVPLDNRILGPAALTLIPFCSVALSASLRSRTSPRTYFLWAMVLTLAFGSFTGLRAWSYAARVHREGSGLRHVSWGKSPTLQFVRGLPESVRLVSDGADVLDVYLPERKTEWLPYKRNMQTVRPMHLYETHMKELHNDAAQGKALVVLFKGKHASDEDFPHYLPNTREILSDANLEVLQEMPDGLILGVRAAWPHLLAAPRKERKPYEHTEPGGDRSGSLGTQPRP